MPSMHSSSDLLVELHSVCSAAQVQQDKIDDLFKQQRLPAPITHLLLTVLSDIIHCVILNTHPEPDAHRCTKRELVSMSHLWRDAIFTFPNLWTTIAIDPLWSISLVMSHKISRTPTVQVIKSICLKHLMIWSEGRIDQLPATSNLQTGIFQWFGPGSGSLLSCLPSYQQLRKLILCGQSDGWPRPQSIHLPALVSLMLKVADPQLALVAMVVPNLNYLEFPTLAIPMGFPNMFTNIQHLQLIGDSNVPHFTPFLESAEAGAMAVCAVCPGIHHLELHANDIPTFFHLNTPTEHWSHLECLTLEGPRVRMIPNDLIQWLKK
ncbi:hypothetical protein EDD17DRAFT_1626599, partial [Pisolithus thermaeus]